MQGLPVAIALLCYGLSWMVPLEAFGAGPFSAHMWRHMMLVAVASPLLLLAVRRSMPQLLPPLVATVLEFAVVWGWHLPRLHEAARLSGGWYLAEQLSFVLAGLLLWESVLRKGHELLGAVALLLTSMHMTLLGVLIVLSPAPLYGGGAGVGAGAGLHHTLEDQQTGGILMLLIGTPVYLIAGLLLVRRVLCPSAQRVCPVVDSHSAGESTGRSV